MNYYKITIIKKLLEHKIERKIDNYFIYLYLFR